MVFSEDKFYNDLNKPLYGKDTICEIPENMVDRWTKRGGRPATEEEIKSGKVVVKKDEDPVLEAGEKKAPEPVKSASFGDNEDDEEEKAEEHHTTKKPATKTRHR